MASRAIHKLTPKQVAAAKGNRRISDGGGLYLSVSDDGRKRWVFLFVLKGRQREMGLGAARRDGVALADAREAASEARKLLAMGKDPLEARRVAQRVLELAARSELVALKTFGECSDDYITAKRSEWKNDKHVSQWETTMLHHAGAIRSMFVRDVDTAAVLSVLQPIWGKTPETAQRLRGRIEMVLDAAKARGLRDGENPARWRGHLKNLLPKRQRLTRGHHRALPYDKIPEFMKALREQKDIAARLLEFTVLTVARSNESRGAKAVEFDLEKAAVPCLLACDALNVFAHRDPIERGLRFLSAFPIPLGRIEVGEAYLNGLVGQRSDA